MTTSSSRLGLAALSLALLAGAAQAQTAPGAADDPCAKPPNRAGADRLLPLGCANAANLRAMIADPADLQRGRDLGPSAGDAAFIAASRYRRDQVKPLDGGAGGPAGAPGADKTGGK